MPVDHFIDVLNSYVPLSGAYQDFLRQHVRTVHAKAKEVLLPFNHHKLVFYFVEKGMIYSWRRDEDGNILPRHFTYEHQLAGTSANPLYPVLIPDGISCLEDSVLVMGEIDISNKAVELFDEANKLITILVNNWQLYLQEIHDALILHDAEQRFRKMQTIAPELFKRVPDRLLASYLHLSRGHYNYIKNRQYKPRKKQ